MALAADLAKGGSLAAASPRERGRRIRSAALALAAGLFVVGLRAPLWDLPLERDEGEYAYIAWRLAAGETPYLDWFDQKPPGVFLAYRLALALPGDPIAAIRLVAAVFCAGSALALFAVVRALLGPAAGVLAALLLALLSADPMLQGPIANTELFMVPGIVAAAALTLRVLAAARPPLATSLAIGALLGVASAFKQVAVVNAPFLIAAFWLGARGLDRARNTARFAGAIAAGGLLVWSAILLWFWRRGALAPALDAILLHNLEYAAQLTLSDRLAQLAYFVPPLLPSQGIAWLVALLGLVALARRRGDRFPALFLGGFAAANALGASASGLYFPHYFQQLLPAVAALAAAALVGAAGLSETPGRRRLAWAGAALILAPLIVACAGFWRLDPAEATRRIYPDNYFEVMPAIAAEIAAQTAPDDRVFIFGAEPEILFYARRVSASRYIFLFPVFGQFSDAEQRQAGVIAELEAARPAVILWIPNQMLFGPGPQRLTQWTLSLVDSAYRLHAFVAPEGSSRGVLQRVGPDADPRALVAERQPWAMIFLRARAGDAPALPATRRAR